MSVQVGRREGEGKEGEGEKREEKSIFDGLFKFKGSDDPQSPALPLISGRGMGREEGEREEGR